jgi:hypothetical protein
MTRYNVVEDWLQPKALYRGIVLDLFDEVVGTSSDRGRILSQGREPRR